MLEVDNARHTRGHTWKLKTAVPRLIHSRCNNIWGFQGTTGIRKSGHIFASEKIK
jgi:hypothetical protein